MHRSSFFFCEDELTQHLKCLYLQEVLPGLLLCITSIDADCRHNVVKSHVISYENHWIWCEQLYSSALVRFYKISSHWTLFGPFSPLTQKLSTRMHALAAFVLAVVARALPFHVQWHQPLHLVQSGQLISSHVYCQILTIQHYVDIYESSTYRYFKYLPTLIRSRSILSTLLSTPRVRASARLEPAKSSPTRDSLQPPEDSLTLDDHFL